MAGPLDMEEQYDRIYRYCYFRLHSQQAAEDITQETFLRYLENYSCVTSEQALKCLYTIARNLCVDKFRRENVRSTHQETLDLQEDKVEERILTGIAVRAAVASLEQDEQELLLLRYVNEVPLLTIAQLYGISRFAVYRKLNAAVKRFKEALRKEGFS